MFRQSKNASRRLLTRFLRGLAIFLNLVWAFFPSIVFLLLAFFMIPGLLQGRDIVALLLEKPHGGFFFIVAVFFWALVTWYSSRLLAFNHDRLFHRAPQWMYHAPRLLGYLCFTAMIYAFLRLPVMHTPKHVAIALTLANVLVYFLVYWFFEKMKEGLASKQLSRYGLQLAVLLVLTTIIAGWFNSPDVYPVCLFIMQLILLFEVIIRRKALYGDEPGLPTGIEPSKTNPVETSWLAWILQDASQLRDKQTDIGLQRSESRLFLLFNVVSAIALVIYLLAVFHLPFSRGLGSFPLMLLAFGILLGFGNFLSLLSRKSGINLHVMALALVFGVGLISEPHQVRLLKTNDNAQPYAKRLTLKAYAENWVAQRMDVLQDSTVQDYPVFLVLADGGASRSGYWTASIMAKLDDDTRGRFREHLFCLSGSSGGSVGNAAYAGAIASIRNGDRQPKLDLVRSYLSNDFLSYTLARMLGPDIFKPAFPFPFVYDRAAALEYSLESVERGSVIGQQMAEAFSNYLPGRDSVGKDMPIWFINATRMQDGRPAVIANIELDTLVFGRRLDILDSLSASADIRVSTAAVLGARFPYVSPAGRLGNQYFVDGGYFDNSGAGVVHDMLLELHRWIQTSVEKDPGSVLRKLKFFVLHTTNSPVDELQVGKVHPMINDLAAPVKTMLGAYSNQTYLQNLRLFKYMLELNHGDTTYIPFHLYTRGEAEKYPMNWVISKATMDSMDQRLKGYAKIQHCADAINARNPEALLHLFKD